MDIRIPEKNKKPRIAYAVTDDGIELPVIDVTHSAFALSVSPREMSALIEQFIREAKARSKVPEFLERWILRAAMRRSTLGRALMASSGTFLSGTGTYLLKLGPDNLGEGYARPVDRKIAASLPALCVRVRLHDMAHLLARGLEPVLRARPAAVCHFVNIAGGPAADSLNALLVLREERPELLAGRRLRIHVLDIDEAGPAFAGRALAALQASGARLHGLDIELRHVPYSWDRTDGLRALLGELAAKEAIVAASSEGGLFEYGSDEAIVDNLAALREGSPRDALMVGSVTRAEGPSLHVRASTGAALRPRSLPAFVELARRAGWELSQHLESPFSHHVALTVAPDPR